MRIFKVEFYRVFDEKTEKLYARQRDGQIFQVYATQYSGLVFDKVESDDIKQLIRTTRIYNKPPNKNRELIKQKLESGEINRSMTLREIGKICGIPHPQTVKFHLGEIENDLK